MIALLMMATATQIPAQFVTGNDLQPLCSNGPNLECGPYVEGFADTIETFAAMGLKRRFCLPLNVTVGQLADVFSKYLKDHPEKRHAIGAGLVVLSLNDAFPCPKYR